MMAAFATQPGETPIDPSGLKARKRKLLVTRSQLNDAEAANVRKATVKYLAGKPTPKSAPFNLAWVQKVHREMFGDVWTWAGKFRNENLSLGMPWGQIEGSLFNLLRDLQSWKEKGVDWIEQSVWLHHRAVQIHPFPNGNGRWARLLANIWLKLHGHAPTEWPAATLLASGNSKIRDDYLAAMKHADAGEYDKLLALHRHYTPRPQ